ncbi:MBL fold metallo-hydrolase [Candidatus Uhrbacteria bacterium]|nr:MBL fold metallo-hydrolase [Candidatus Uhrbacteria bacterium]
MPLTPSRARSRVGRVTQRRRLRAALLAGAFFAAALVLQWAEAGPIPVTGSSGLLRVWTFDIGQGDALLIEMPTGEQILVDAGPGDAVLPKLGSALPPWDRTIDAIVLTHPHEDHIAGFVKVLARYDVGAVYETGAHFDVPTRRAFDEAIKDEGADRRLVHDGMEFRYGDVRLEVMAPDRDLNNKKIEDQNMGSVVMLLTYGDTSILLTGDAPVEQEEEFLPDLAEPVDVLKVAHHGSAYSTSQKFLAIARPRYALISSGEGNDYGHPHPVLLQRLRDFQVQTWRTDLDGDLLVTSDGGEPTVEAHPLPF